MNAIKRIVLVAALLCCACPAFGEYIIHDLLNITINSLSADVPSDTAFARGVGRIPYDSPQGIYLARRAAISDAQRGLLILKRSLEEKAPPRSGDVAGHVPSLTLISESVADGLYFVEAEVSLSALIGRKNDEAPNAKEREHTEDKEEDDNDEHNEDN